MINSKYIKKYMKMARLVALEGNPCLSERQVGAVIVDPEKNAVVSIGVNGPPTGTPHTDTKEYLTEMWSWLEEDEKEKFPLKQFVCDNTGCKTCPRRIIGAPSGKRLELCSCAHGEANALVNASKTNSSTWKCHMFCWCGVPCIECSKLIINGGIKRIYCLEEPIYSAQSPWLLKKGNVEVVELNREEFE